MSDFPEDIFSEPADVDPRTLENLGPLRGMAGVWEGTRGWLSVDAPDRSGAGERTGERRMGATFLRDILSNRNNRTILDRWRAFELPDGWLVAGCLFQTVWNARSNRPPEAGIKDYDVFYFDPVDLSGAAELRVAARVERVLQDLAITVEVKNQARVHLWYESHFGFPYPRLARSSDGIDRFLVAQTSVGVRPVETGLEVYAPHGVEAIYEGRLSPNPLTDHPLLFQDKARSYVARWPWLRIDASG